MITSTQALEKLRQGNERFVAGDAGYAFAANDEVRQKLKDGQAPFAVILGCSDSRVPAEIVFDQGLGDLFVIRVAGNVVAPSQIGSIEFAVTSFATPLVVVLGHSGCGAIAATLAHLRGELVTDSENLESIIQRISPALKPLLGSDGECDMEPAVKANIRACVDQLQQQSPALAQGLSTGGLQIVGAEYCLESGRVEFLED